jgi:hypothetical protein
MRYFHWPRAFALAGCLEVTTDSLYEAVAQGLRAFLENDWVEDIGRGQTMITVDGQATCS